ncbi:hypothetical protein [Weissella bombi]|uniref:hypothetical protein n=1 Tax=Weissella bombi TaxID=1505725 RepID=UPI003AF27793
MHNNKLIIDVVGKVTVDGLVKDYFDKKFWSPLTQEQVVQAWLHPETIKVVDNDV